MAKKKSVEGVSVLVQQYFICTVILSKEKNLFCNQHFISVRRLFRHLASSGRIGFSNPIRAGIICEPMARIFAVIPARPDVYRGLCGIDCRRCEDESDHPFFQDCDSGIDAFLSTSAGFSPAIERDSDRRKRPLADRDLHGDRSRQLWGRRDGCRADGALT